MRSPQTKLLSQKKPVYLPIIKIDEGKAPLIEVVRSNAFTSTILCVILFNTIMIAMQTFDGLNERYSYYFSAIDQILLGIYVAEIGLKLYAFERSFFKSGWNVFDFGIVLISLVEFAAYYLFQFATSGVNPQLFRVLRLFRAFRAFRVLRVLRTISFVKKLQIIVNTLLKSVPAMGSIVLLLLLVLYIFAIIGVTLYKESYPERFRSIWVAFFSLFQIITLDDWFMYYDNAHAEEPYIVVYLVIFIVVEAFIFINLFIAVIVNNLEEYHRKERKRKAERERLESEKVIQAQREQFVKKSMKLRQRVVSTGLERPIDLKDLYPNSSMWELGLLADYYASIASLDSYVDILNTHQEVLDELVDAVVNADAS